MVEELYSREELIEKFGWEEYFIFSLFLAVSAGIGVFFWWKGQKSTADFILGNKNVSTFPITLSLVVSFLSAITLLGTPAEMYVYGTQYAMLVLSFPLVMAAAAHMYMPVFYELNVTTSYEYLEWRFNKPVRLLGAFCFVLYMVFYLAIVVYAPALAIQQVTGFDVNLACAVIFAVCIFYTSLGGIKAVVWSDVFQAAVMFGSFLAVTIKGNSEAGHFKQVFDLNYQTDRIELFNFSVDMTERHTFWSVVIGGYFFWMSLYGVNQSVVQRAIWWNGLGIAAVVLLCVYAGLVIFAFYYAAGCDPLKAGQVDTRDQLFPMFVMQIFGDVPCVPGLFIAGIFSGTLSTVSGGLNSLATVTLLDFVEAGAGWELSKKTSLFITKSLALAYGLICFGFVYVAKYLPGVLEAVLGLAGMIGGPVLGTFTLGMFFPWANSLGAFVGTAVSLLFTLWMGMGQTVSLFLGTYAVPTKNTTIEGCPDDWIIDVDTEESGDTWFHHLKLYEVSYIWFTGISCLTTFVLGAAISLVTKPQDPKLLKPELISPGMRGLFSWWPKFVVDYIDSIGVGEKYLD